MDDLPKIRRFFSLVGVSELDDCEVSPCKTHLEAHNTNQLKESSYGTHYGDLLE